MNFSTSISVENSPQEVFEAITKVREWWNRDDFEGKCSKIGDEFVIYHPNQHYSRQRIIEFIPYQKICWLVTQSTLFWLKKDKNEWTNTQMIFEICQKDEKTQLNFTHKGLVPEKECYAMCEKGWNMVINNWLSYYLQHGISSPEMEKAAEIREQSLKS